MDSSLIMPIIFVLVGLTLLVGAGDLLIRGSVAVASRLGVSTLVVGLTVVAFGTSAPELLVGIDAVMKGAPTLAIGNVVGSNIANILLVLGAPALIAPLVCDAPRLGRNIVFMLFVSVLVIVIGFLGPIGFYEGLGLTLLLVGFLYLSVKQAREDGEEADQTAEVEYGLEDHGVELDNLPNLNKGVLFLIIGLIGIAAGADFLVDGAVTIAQSLGVAESIIGLTLVAIGTSLPELVTSVASALKGHSDVAVGNVIGSNVFNLLGILGISSLVGDIPVPRGFLAVDLWVMLGASLALLVFFGLKKPIGRVSGLAMLLLYVGYMVYLLQVGGL